MNLSLREVLFGIALSGSLLTLGMNGGSSIGPGNDGGDDGLGALFDRSGSAPRPSGPDTRSTVARWGLLAANVQESAGEAAVPVRLRVERTAAVAGPAALASATNPYISQQQLRPDQVTVCSAYYGSGCSVNNKPLQPGQPPPSGLTCSVNGSTTYTSGYCSVNGTATTGDNTQCSANSISNSGAYCSAGATPAPGGYTQASQCSSQGGYSGSGTVGAAVCSAGSANTGTTSYTCSTNGTMFPPENQPVVTCSTYSGNHGACSSGNNGTATNSSFCSATPGNVNGGSSNMCSASSASTGTFGQKCSAIAQGGDTTSGTSNCSVAAAGNNTNSTDFCSVTSTSLANAICTTLNFATGTTNATLQCSAMNSKGGIDTTSTKCSAKTPMGVFVPPSPGNNLCGSSFTGHSNPTNPLTPE